MLNIELNTARYTPRAEVSAELLPPDAETIASRIVSIGAIMTVPGCPVTRFLVGHFVWVEPRRVFWFTAYGDSPADGHLLEFDDAHCVEPLGVCFTNGGRVVGELMRIEDSGLEDPDDYRIAWQLWQEIAPLRTTMIDTSGSRLFGDAWRNSGLRIAPGRSVGALRAPE